MTMWLERREKIYRHNQFVDWRVQQREKPQPRLFAQPWSPPGLDLDRQLHLAKRLTVRSVTIAQLVSKHGARFFKEALARFVTLTNNPDIIRARLEQAIWNTHLPFRKLAVWHHLKFLRVDPVTGKPLTADSIHATPARTNSRGKAVSHILR
ncbi:hypothetical protein HGRIS_001273 [Hohenbuehelia grisea]|uniref:Transposase n=1 Tax=Hohenbuehelia grisea TaxID=104357 RepID=A0ABR3JPV9_9AGAR